MNRKEAYKLSKKWHKMFRLQNWKMVNSVAEKLEEDGDESNAEVLYDNVNKAYTVRFNKKRLNKITESTIIHEHIHVVLVPVTEFVDCLLKKMFYGNSEEFEVVKKIFLDTILEPTITQFEQCIYELQKTRGGGR